MMSWGFQLTPMPKLASCDVASPGFAYLFPLEVRVRPALYLAFGHCVKRTNGLDPEKNVEYSKATWTRPWPVRADPS